MTTPHDVRFLVQKVGVLLQQYPFATQNQLGALLELEYQIPIKQYTISRYIKKHYHDEALRKTAEFYIKAHEKGIKDLPENSYVYSYYLDELKKDFKNYKKSIKTQQKRNIP